MEDTPLYIPTSGARGLPTSLPTLLSFSDGCSDRRDVEARCGWVCASLTSHVPASHVCFLWKNVY